MAPRPCGAGPAAGGFARRCAAVIAQALAGLGVDARAPGRLPGVRCLAIGGWGAWCAYERWQARLAGKNDDQLEQLLAIRLTWEWLLRRCAGGYRARRLGRAVERRRRTGPAARGRPGPGLAAAGRARDRLPAASVGGVVEGCGSPPQPLKCRHCFASTCARKSFAGRSKAWMPRCTPVGLRDFRPAHRLCAGGQCADPPATAGAAVARAVCDRARATPTWRRCWRASGAVRCSGVHGGTSSALHPRRASALWSRWGCCTVPNWPGQNFRRRGVKPARWEDAGLPPAEAAKLR